MDTSSVIFSRLNTIKGAAKTPGDLSILNTLTDMKTMFLAPERYDKHPPSFLMGLPLGPIIYNSLKTTEGSCMDHTSANHEVLTPLLHCSTFVQDLHKLSCCLIFSNVVPLGLNVYMLKFTWKGLHFLLLCAQPCLLVLFHKMDI